MAEVIINGKRVQIPSPKDAVRGRDIINQVNPRDGRRPVIQRGINVETIDPNKSYNKRELLDRKGKPVKATTIPDRTKGSFWLSRSELSKKIITEQVYDMALECFKDGVDFDEQDAHWMMVPKYILPPMWHNIAKTTPLMVVFPTEYPELPPIGCYLKAELAGAPDGHLFPNVYHQAAQEPIAQGWKWYCVFVKEGSWQPARVKKSGDWKFGDNLWTYFTLIKEALSTE